MIADPRKVDDLAVYIQNWNTERFRVRTYQHRLLNALGKPLPLCGDAPRALSFLGREVSLGGSLSPPGYGRDGEVGD